MYRRLSKKRKQKSFIVIYSFQEIISDLFPGWSLFNRCNNFAGKDIYFQEQTSTRNNNHYDEVRWRDRHGRKNEYGTYITQDNGK